MFWKLKLILVFVHFVLLGYIFLQTCLIFEKHVKQVKKLQHEKRLDMIVDPDLLEYDVKEVEQMIQVALLCSRPSPEERPNMAEVVRMLSGEGLAERWEEWQQVEVIRRQEYDAMPQRLNEWVEDSTVNQEAVQLSSAR